MKGEQGPAGRPMAPPLAAIVAEPASDTATELSATYAGKVATGFVYATDYGVTANGVTDDTAAMQTFVNYTVLNKRIGVLPAGTIKLTGTINFEQRPGWQLRGAGEEKTIISQATDNIPISTWALRRGRRCIRSCSRT